MMSGIEPGSAKATTKSTIKGYESFPAPEKPKEGGRGNFKADSISIKNYFAKLAVSLLSKVDGALGDTGAGQSQSILEQVVIEASSRYQFNSILQPSQPPGAGKASAYEDRSGEAGEKYGLLKTEAELILQAHEQAFSGDPFSPEATADRIVNFAVSFFPMFAADNPDMTHQQQVEAYREMVEGAIDEGFKDALQILGALPNDISANIEQTRSLVSEKLDAFFNQLAGEGAEEGKKAASQGAWGDYARESFNSYQQAEQRAYQAGA